MRGSLQHEVVRSIIDNSSLDELSAFNEYLNNRMEYLKGELKTNLLEYANELIGKQTIADMQILTNSMRLTTITGFKLNLFFEYNACINFLLGNGNCWHEYYLEDKEIGISRNDKNIQDVLKIWLPLARKIVDKRKELKRRRGVA